MKEITVISGKGGTGKTSITAAFAALHSPEYKGVFADCDVDAADLHLILEPENLKSTEFFSGHVAIINESHCSKCGKCIDLCRFGAISFTENLFPSIDDLSCEGCGVCAVFCPNKAIDFPERLCGVWNDSITRFGRMIHARLEPQSENSGKLVTQVRKEARLVAESENADLIVIDGPPGTGCPVIASITGVDAVVIITEPTLSGKHDLLRTVVLASHFQIPVYVCVNKWDINPEITEQIVSESQKYNYIFLGKIDYDRALTEAQIEGKTVIEYIDNQTTKQIKEIWSKICQSVLQTKTAV